MTDRQDHAPTSAGGPATDPHASARMVRADLLAAIAFIVLGAAILYGSWTMDRLEVRRINPMTVPGLVPGMLSAALIVCGAILGLRSLRVPAENGWSELGAGIISEGTRRALAVATLALVYTLGLVGLVPFWAATGVFVAAFIIVFECWLAHPRKPILHVLPWALGLAVVTAVAVTLVFERAFLVRLP